MEPVLDQPSFMRLRWVWTVVLGLVLAAGLANVLPGPPVGTAVAIGLVAVGLNGVHYRLGAPLNGLVLTSDVVLLTVLLGASGGIANPFTLLYLFPVVMGALVSSSWFTGVLGALSIVSFGGLYAVSGEHHHMEMSTHLIGMVAAYAVTVPLLGLAVHRFRTSAALAEAEARRARASREVAERLASLAALAGGAAHELATPLATIQMIASERLRAVRDTPVHEAASGDVVPLVTDLEEVLEEVRTCRAILDQLSVDAGASRADGWVRVELEAFLRQALVDARPAPRLDVEPVSVELPDRLLAQAVRRLVDNARDACGGEGRVEVTARVQPGGDVRFRVADDGPGAEPEVLDRACEPFFTTKSSGRGLGLFFVHSLAVQLGGTFQLRRGTPRGLVAELTIPTALSGRAPCASS